jgi:pimeloyl-ACP methyl ester carboxylesterase
VIAPDRPGIGWSDRDKSRTVASWGADVRALADHLTLERFAVFGWSAGGPHALACAAALPDRVSRVATCGGMAPIRNGADRKELGLAADRMLIPLCRHASLLARVALLAASGRRGPERARKQFLRALGDTDRKLLEPWPAKELVCWEGDRVGAFVNGTAGAVDDYRAYGAPDWGLDLDGVQQQVDCWHGEDDELVPMSHAERLAASLPNATLHNVEGGHFLPAQPATLTEILRRLAD